MRYMKTFLVTAVLATIILGAVSAANAQVSIGIRIGAPPPPRVVRVRPAQPGADFVWIDGYWYAVGKKWRWHEGYWTRAPFAGARWVAPRYEGGQFFDGYWEGGGRRLPHDHKWDRDHDRDFGRDRR